MDHATRPAKDVTTATPPPLPRFNPRAPSMLGATVRGKTLLIIIVTLIGLLVLISIPLRVILLNSFASLEEQNMRRNIERAVNALHNETESLLQTARDYANWDDTYTFVLARNHDYITTNYSDKTFITNRLNVVLIVDNNGQIVFERGFDWTNNRVIAVPEHLHTLVTTNDPVVRHTDGTNGKAGVLTLPDGPMLIAVNPILTSAYAGPSRGTFIMGRFLNDEAIQRLETVTRLSLQLYHLDDDQFPPDVQVLHEELLRGETIVRPLNTQTIAGYAPLPDVYGDPCLLVRVDSNRSMYAQGQASVGYFTVALLVACLVFGGVVLVLFENLVLSRVAQLNANVQQIATNSNPSARITTTGVDEIAELAGSINTMLEALEQAQIERHRAEEAGIRAKSEFVSSASHELRTPLTPIRGYVDMLLSDTGGPLTEQQRNFLSIIKANTVQMSVLVEDLLEVGRMDSGNLTLSYSQFDLCQTIRDVIELLRLELERKAIHLVVQTPDALPMIEADEQRVRQVLTNLISNAIKYTYPQGRVWIGVYLRGNDMVEVQVEDTGVGLTPEQQQKLFTRFYRADNPLRDHVNGAGLGLALAKTFVQMHGGEIWVRSEANVGSLFAFTLPIRQQQVE